MTKILSKILGAGSLPSAGQLQRGQRQLSRLETLIDAVFALVIVLLVFDLPLSDDAPAGIAELILDRANTFLLALVGIGVVLVYWYQSNMLLGNLVRTDATHSMLCVLQVVFVLGYLAAVGLGYIYEGEPWVLAAQSATAALVGLAAAAAWWYASYDRRLLSTEINDDEVGALRLRALAEPMTALLTLVLAFVGLTAWELGWLAYPLIVALLRRAHNG